MAAFRPEAILFPLAYAFNDKRISRFLYVFAFLVVYLLVVQVFIGNLFVQVEQNFSGARVFSGIDLFVIECIIFLFLSLVVSILLLFQYKGLNKDLFFITLGFFVFFLFALFKKSIIFELGFIRNWNLIMPAALIAISNFEPFRRFKVKL